MDENTTKLRIIEIQETLVHLKERLQELKELKNRYVYFLLATAAAAITYAMQRTASTALQPQDYLLGAAVSFWGCSFYAGCRNRQLLMVKIDTEFAETIGPMADLHFDMLDLGEIAKELRMGVEKFMAAADKAGKKALKDGEYFLNLQFRALVLGALLFVAWHVYGMYLLTPKG